MRKLIFVYDDTKCKVELMTKESVESLVADIHTGHLIAGYKMIDDGRDIKIIEKEG